MTLTEWIDMWNRTASILEDHAKGLSGAKRDIRLAEVKVIRDMIDDLGKREIAVE